MSRSWLLLSILFAIAAFPAEAAKKVALVVGNGNYEHTGKLVNPANDAALIAKSLEKVGFSVSLLSDGTHKQMLETMTAFGRQSKNADVALFYYAGHGLEVFGSNWILPVNADIEASSDLPSSAVKVDDVLDSMEFSGAKVRIIVLDACRNNPLPRSLSRSTSRGLAKIDASAAGTMVVFAAAPGNVALDGSGKNSPFSEAFAANLTKSDLEIRQMIGRVRQDVMASTNDEQVPWVNEAIVGDFYLAGRKDTEPASETRIVAKTGADESASRNTRNIEVELAFWNSVKDSSNADLLGLYLGKYPDGEFVELAQALIASIQTEPVSREADTVLQSTPKPSVDGNTLQKMELSARDFVNRFNEMGSAAPETFIASLQDFYASRVNFYGKPYSLSEIAADKRRFVKRWPERSYFSPQKLILVSCNEAAQKCELQTDVHWNVASSERSQSANGVQRTYLELDFSLGAPKVVSEDSKNITPN